MSRTYRRKKIYDKSDIHWCLFDWSMRTISVPHPPLLDPKSKEGKKGIALYHADGHYFYKEPGPAWYRHETVEIPQRREAKRQMRCVLRDQEFVVILESKCPLKYWT